MSQCWRKVYINVWNSQVNSLKHIVWILCDRATQSQPTQQWIWRNDTWCSRLFFFNNKDLKIVANMNSAPWVNCWTTFGCSYSCKSFGVCLYQLCSSYTAIFAHSSLQNSLTSVRLDGQYLWVAIFKSCCRFSIGFRSGLWLNLLTHGNALNWAMPL